jgi:disulfide bond formation protein DsbB
MDRDTVILFLALLTVATQISVAVGLVISASPRIRYLLVDTVGPVGMVGGACVAAVSMIGSLYLSEVAHFTPCKLCWYQRIAMYPIAIVLVIAAIRRDRSPRFSMRVLAGIGAVISVYHILIENFPEWESSSCDPLNPCSLKWVDKFGYVTIPVMALTGFITISLLLVAHAMSEKRLLGSPLVGE